MLGPVSGGYPGKYVCFAFAVFVAGIYAFSLVRFRRVVNPQRKAGAIHRDDYLKKPSWPEMVGVGVFCAFLVGSVLWDVYTHWPN